MLDLPLLYDHLPMIDKIYCQPYHPTEQKNVNFLQFPVNKFCEETVSRFASKIKHIQANFIFPEIIRKPQGGQKLINLLKFV